jgi:Transposase DDE domain
MNNELLPQLPTLQSLHFLSILSSCGFDLDSCFDIFTRAKGGRPRKLKLSQLIVCLELKSKYFCENWLGLYRVVVDVHRVWNTPSYANFLHSLKSLIRFLVELIHAILNFNRIQFFSRIDKIAYIDSTPLPVCKVIRSSRHRTMAGFAQYSKSTTGWYYGLKLHAICDYSNTRALFITITNATIDDRIVLAKSMLNPNLFYNSRTLFVADKGYQAKWLELLAYQTGNYLLTGKKKSKILS